MCDARSEYLKMQQLNGLKYSFNFLVLFVYIFLINKDICYFGFSFNTHILNKDFTLRKCTKMNIKSSARIERALSYKTSFRQVVYLRSNFHVIWITLCRMNFPWDAYSIIKSELRMCVCIRCELLWIEQIHDVNIC